jgi:hypothetical protein
MATTCTCSGSLSFTASLIKALTASNPADAEALSASISIANGTGANKANRSYIATRSLGSSSNETLILNGDATFKDAFGDAINFTKLNLLAIYNAGTAILSVGGGSNPISLTDGSTDAIQVRPGGWLVMYIGTTDTTGILVNSTTHCNLKIAAGSGGATYTVLLVGESA